MQPVLEAMIAAGNGRFRGIRFGTAWDGTDSTKSYGRRETPRHQLLDPTLRKGLARLQAARTFVDAWMFYPQLPELADLLRAFPNANVILATPAGCSACHMTRITRRSRSGAIISVSWHSFRT